MFEREENYRASAYVRLDPDKIKYAIDRQELKRWWVAEFSGVHKTTLRRWLSGKIARVHKKNANALANLLEVELETILG